MASLSTHIPKEITDYKEKIIGGLTLRQLAAGSAAFLVGGLTYLICHMVFGLDARQSSYFIMFAVTLIAAVGFLRPNNMDFEQYLLLRYQHWLRSRPVKYKTITRGDSQDVPVPSKAKARKGKSDTRECVIDYYVYDRRRERKIIRATRKTIRHVRKDAKKAQKQFRKRHKS